MVRSGGLGVGSLGAESGFWHRVKSRMSIPLADPRTVIALSYSKAIPTPHIPASETPCPAAVKAKNNMGL